MTGGNHMIVGLDCGNHKVKLYSPQSRLIFDRYLMNANPRALETGAEKWLVEVDGNPYFIGELAEMEGATMAFVRDKANHSHTVPLTFASLALSQPTNPIIKVQLVTGLPLIDLGSQKDALHNVLLGEHVVRINNGSKQWIEVEECIVFGEGAGAIWDSVLDLNGNVKRKPRTWERVIDIGYRTVDFCALKDLYYVADQSTSLPLGIYHAQMDTYKRVGTEIDCLPEQVEPDEQSLKALAEQIQTRISKVWLDRQNIQLAGGGALLLGNYLPYNVLPEPGWSNAIGYYKVGVAKWQKGKK
jgi:hypothetical protein